MQRREKHVGYVAPDGAQTVFRYRDYIYAAPTVLRNAGSNRGSISELPFDNL